MNEQQLHRCTICGNTAPNLIATAYRYGFWDETGYQSGSSDDDLCQTCYDQMVTDPETQIIDFDHGVTA